MTPQAPRTVATSHGTDDPRNPAYGLLIAAEVVVGVIEQTDTEEWDAREPHREALATLKKEISKARRRQS